MDLEQERSYLARGAFARLRDRCGRHGLDFCEIDLRWGITEEQSRRAQTIGLCLREIERCRPHFVALLGGRYGWIPEALEPALLAEFPWVGAHRGASVTEMEIRHGALAASNSSASVYLKALPLDAVEPRQRHLRAEVEASGLRVRPYATLEELDRMVEADLWSQVAAAHQLAETADPLLARLRGYRLSLTIARERGDDEPTARFRWLGTRPQLPRHRPLLVHGSPGSGKTLYLARMLAADLEVGDRGLVLRPDSRPVLVHMSEVAGAKDWQAAATDLLAQADRQWPQDPNAPSQAAGGLEDRLAAALSRAGDRALLVIDGSEALAGSFAAEPLAWLPFTFSPGIRCVVSSSSDADREAAVKRGWRVISLRPLAARHRRRQALRYLARFGKNLTPAQLESLAATRAAGLPLFLRTVLDELRLAARFEDLEGRLRRYLSAADLDTLLAMVLERLEAEGARTGGSTIVRDVCAYLWAARQGLGERDLMLLLGEAGRPLPAAEWSPLLLALGDALVLRGTRLRLRPSARAVVERRYLHSAAQRCEAHATLGAYFRRGHDGAGRTEAPWQLYCAQDWPALAAELADPATLVACARRSPHDVTGYWAGLERAAGLTPDVLHRRLIEEAQPTEAVKWLADLSRDSGRTALAAPLYAWLARSAELAAEHARALESRVALAHLERMRGNLAGARSQLAAARESLTRTPELTRALLLSEEAAAAIDLDDATAAIEQLQQAARIYDEHGDFFALGRCLGNQARARLVASSEPAGGHPSAVARGQAMTLLARQEKVARRYGDLISLLSSLTSQATLLRLSGRAAAGRRALTKARELLRFSADPEARQALLLEEARALEEVGDFDGAEALADEHLRLCKEAGLLRGEIEGLLLAAEIRYNTPITAHRRDEATQLVETGLALATQHGLARHRAQAEHVLKGKALPDH